MTIRNLRRTLAGGGMRPLKLAVSAFAQSNKNAGGNTYIWQEPVWTRAEAARVEAVPRSNGGSL